MEPLESEDKSTKGRYITEEIEELFPVDQDEFIRIPKGDYQRLIFGEPRELVPREITQRDKFFAWVEENKKDPIPEAYLDHQRLWLRYL